MTDFTQTADVNQFPGGRRLGRFSFARTGDGEGLEPTADGWQSPHLPSTLGYDVAGSPLPLCKGRGGPPTIKSRLRSILQATTERGSPFFPGL
jgi:hypothetical protein